MQKTILCYGDSNTWGYIPNGNPNGAISRFARDERWPGRLQYLLGENYYVIEEGLNGRTTNLNYFIPPDRNGKTYLPPCLYSHAPIDLVILALGGNDLKVYFDRQPEAIRDGLAELIGIIQSSLYGENFQRAPNILITTVPMLLPIAEHFRDEEERAVFAGAIEKAKRLVELYAELAQTKQCHFLDISQTVIPSEIDGGHFDKKAHQLMAEIMRIKIEEIFKTK